ncbi:contractile injection system protein, VgrG/Pvc8 family, partial [Rodentibacter caecimuris]|uniref:contractile injection system protein, VgrG/Pvc8 family n=1 Tax=Rodentibacter caecimuris TaxID=1796644 RepID=UPI00296ED76F
YCVQYRETDLAFMERLAAEEGWYYYFEHHQDSHRLHFAHQSPTTPISATLPYHACSGGDRPFAGLWQWRYKCRVTPNRQTLRDYTFLHPHYNLEHQHHAPSSMASSPSPSAVNSDKVYEKYDYPSIKPA